MSEYAKQQLTLVDGLNLYFDLNICGAYPYPENIEVLPHPTDLPGASAFDVVDRTMLPWDCTTVVRALFSSVLNREVEGKRLRRYALLRQFINEGEEPFAIPFTQYVERVDIWPDGRVTEVRKDTGSTKPRPLDYQEGLNRIREVLFLGTIKSATGKLHNN